MRKNFIDILTQTLNEGETRSLINQEILWKTQTEQEK